MASFCTFAHFVVTAPSESGGQLGPTAPPYGPRGPPPLRTCCAFEPLFAFAATTRRSQDAEIEARGGISSSSRAARQVTQMRNGTCDSRNAGAGDIGRAEGGM